MPLPNRRHAEIVDIGPFAVKVGFLDGRAVEVFIIGRGKTGSELDRHLYAIGVAASKLMQGKEFSADDLTREYPDTLFSGPSA